VLDGRILIGQCDPQKPFLHQSWLYTKKEFDDFDLSLDYWLRLGANSGVSIRDLSRGRYAIGAQADPMRTPARLAYEINIDNGPGSGYDITGSIYLLVKAKPGIQRKDDWNRLEIRARKNLIRVTLNGQIVAEHPGLQGRPVRGPIGLQLHDSNVIVMFRNLRLREVR